MTNIKDIKIYSTKTCGYCRAEKKFLEQHDVPYKEIMVDSDEAAAREMIALSGQMGVPFTVIKKADDTEEHILGFDQRRLTAVLGL